jgi:cytochrome P450
MFLRSEGLAERPATFAQLEPASTHTLINIASGGIVDTKVLTPLDLTGSFTTLHSVLRDAAREGPLATDVVTSATVVLRQNDVETLSHDPRLSGIGLTLFDMMGITDGPLRDWYSQIMFTTEGDYHRRIRSLVSRAFTPRSVEALRSMAIDLADEAVASVGDGGDLVPACSPLGTRLICRLLGVPDSDVAVFAEWAKALSPVFNVMTRTGFGCHDRNWRTAVLRRRVDEAPRRGPRA